ncbi:CDK-activating kinase assembly factor MAT1 [Paragonimus westermani]|uniref:CDK-activating kinase assembly factor MAT1 n=1 Tax=Paragonimus westermani TaxID=34504 RepID=A0A5J4NP78_9TREM|nr:CDK-activating kinase assembly factor MAT1 [Paragonimus westermani]
MLDSTQTCPSCRSSKYTNPQLKLMINTCGHSLCENCVEVLFVRGSGLCVQCKTPVRKANFRYQLFEDPSVQKEVELRKKILNDFNKREEDFDSLEEYDLYLEKIEEIIYNLMNDVSVEETKRYIELYKKENKDIIKKNRLKPSASMQFYESELEREELLREQWAKEDEERRNMLLNGSSAINVTTDGKLDSPIDQRHPAGAPPASDHRLLTPATIKPPPPSMARVVPPPSGQFIAPATAVAHTRMAVDRAFVPLPPTAVGSGFLAPPSMMSSFGPMVGRNWAIEAHHQVILPGRSIQQQRTPDTVLIPSRTQPTRVSQRLDAAPAAAFVYEPYEPDLCGPPTPTAGHIRWPDLVQLYVDSIINRLKPTPVHELKRKGSPCSGTISVSLKSEPNSAAAPEVKPFDRSSQWKSEPMTVDDQKPTGLRTANDNLTTSEDSNLIQRVGSSHQLPDGACGIAPVVFLERCIQESRCGLFL